MHAQQGGRETLALAAATATTALVLAYGTGRARRALAALYASLLDGDATRLRDTLAFDLDGEPDRVATFAVKSDEELLVAKYGSAARDAMPMWVADMDLACAPALVRALCARVAHPIYGYTLQPAVVWEAVREWLRLRQGWAVPTEALVFAPSTVCAAANCVRAFSSAGDSVVVLTPLYPPLRHIVSAEGRVLVELRMQSALSPAGTDPARWATDLAALTAQVELERVTMLILCNPHNPGGRAWTSAELGAICDVCARADVVIVADEIHADLIHAHATFAPCARVAAERAAIGRKRARVITLCSPSKAFNVAGLGTAFLVLPGAAERAAYLAVCEHAHGAFGGVFQTTVMITCYAAPPCARWLDATLRHIGRNVATLVGALRARCPEIIALAPDAGYLVWLDCAGLQLSGPQLAKWWSVRARVLPSLGVEFGDDAETARCARINVAVPAARLDEAIRRIVGAVEWLRAARASAEPGLLRELSASASQNGSTRALAVSASSPTAAPALVITPPPPPPRPPSCETRTSFKFFSGAVLVRYDGELKGSAVELEDLSDCAVLLLDVSSQVTIDRCTNCTFVIGPCSGSIFLRDSENCSLSAVCRQLRTRACAKCDVFAHTLGAIVETSSHMRFERWNAAYPGQAAHFQKAALDVAQSNWADVYDFNKGDNSIAAPHWSLLPSAAFSRLEVFFDGPGADRLLGAGVDQEPRNAAAGLLTAELAASHARVMMLEPPAVSPFAAERVAVGKRLIDGKWTLVYEDDEMAARPTK